MLLIEEICSRDGEVLCVDSDSKKVKTRPKLSFGRGKALNLSLRVSFGTGSGNQAGKICLNELKCTAIEVK